MQIIAGRARVMLQNAGWSASVIITIISLRTHFQIDALSQLLKDLAMYVCDGAPPAKELYIYVRGSNFASKDQTRIFNGFVS